MGVWQTLHGLSMLYFGALQVLDGNMTLGMYFAFQSYAGQFPAGSAASSAPSSASARSPTRTPKALSLPLIKQSKKLPSELYQSLTWDRGKEMADHKRLAVAADVEVYFSITVAARFERKHQPASAPIPAPRNRSVPA